jgi:ABC-2 type transport system permease protein
MKAFTIAKKTLLETWRDRQLAVIYLTFPAMMILLYYVAFGQTTSMAAYLTVLVDNRDTGHLGSEFVRALRAVEFDGQPVFTLQEGLDRNAAEIALAEGKAAVQLTIPPDFSAVLQGQAGSLRSTTQLELLGDPLSDTYVFARSFLSDGARSFVDRQTGWNRPLPVSIEFLPNTGKMSDFQFGVPGVIVFGVLFGTITSALMVVREASSGTLARIRLSGAGGGQVLGGIVLANLVMALVQVPLSFAAALAFGFRSPGSLLLATGIGLVLSLGATGCGFLSACFASSEGGATAVSTAVMVPLVFLSGAIFPLPAARLFNLGGQPVQAYDLMPSTHAAEAMRRVLVYGDGPAALTYELGMLVVLSLALLALGAWVYQKKVLQDIN